MPGSGLSAATLSKPEPLIGKLARIGLILVVGCAGLAWGGLNAKRGAASDVFRDIETHLLKFKTFSPANPGATQDRAPVAGQNARDAKAHRPHLLLEITL